MSGFTLIDRLGSEYIEYNGNRYYCNLAFDIVLRSQDVMRDELFSVAEKYTILFKMFFDEHYYELNLDINDAQIIIDELFANFIDDKEESVNVGSKRETYNLKQDAPYIYASFMQDYGIDLFDCHGTLHWKKFLSMLGSLSDKTKLSQVINIRTQPIPQPTKHNQEERKRIIELKKIYALKSEDPLSDIENADAILSAFSEGLKPK